MTPIPWPAVALGAGVSLLIGLAVAVVAARRALPRPPVNPFDLDDDEAFAVWSRGPRYGVPACRYCGGRTMHDGDVCYGCAHAPEARP